MIRIKINSYHAGSRRILTLYQTMAMDLGAPLKRTSKPSLWKAPHSHIKYPITTYTLASTTFSYLPTHLVALPINLTTTVFPPLKKVFIY